MTLREAVKKTLLGGFTVAKDGVTVSERLNTEGKFDGYVVNDEHDSEYFFHAVHAADAFVSRFFGSEE